MVNIFLAYFIDIWGFYYKSFEFHIFLYLHLEFYKKNFALLNDFKTNSFSYRFYS